MNLIFFLIIGALAGWIAGQLTKGRGFGLLGNLGLGVPGSIIGGFALGLLGFRSAGLLAQLITSVLGAVILLAIVGRIRR